MKAGDNKLFINGDALIYRRNDKGNGNELRLIGVLDLIV